MQKPRRPPSPKSRITSSYLDLHRRGRQSVLDNLNTHGLASAKDLSADALEVVLGQIRVNGLLHLGDLVDVFDTHAACALMPWHRAALLKTRSFLDKVGRGRRLDGELETTVNVCLKNDAHRYIPVELSGPVVKFLAKLHHIDT